MREGVAARVGRDAKGFDDIMSELGVVLSLAGIEETVAMAQLAERAGFESVWTTEFPDHSATVGLAAVAMETERVTVGSAIAYAFGRTPLVLAAEARDLDALSGGRLILGLGTGTRRMQRDWHGLDGEHPAPRMEELVPLLRALLRLDEGPVEHQGRFYRTVVHPTVPVPPPLRTDLPIYMGGVNPRMVEAAGAVADGLVGHPLFTREYTRDVVRPALARGAERAGRAEPPPIAGYLTCVVDEDGDAARQAARGVIAFNSTVKTYRPILSHHGFDEQADRIREAWERGDFAGMAAAVSDEMVEAIAIAGTADEAVAQYQERRAGLFERSLLWTPLGGFDRVRAVIEAFGSPAPGPKA
jgi:probable F420-dependent oxidoreductase